MRSDNHHWIIFLAVAPLVLGLMLYTSWLTTGALPFDLGAISFPAISLPALPSLPDLSITIPPMVRSFWERITQTGPTMWAALFLSMVAGIVFVGTLADAVRALGGVFSRLRDRSETPLDEF